ncbi:MAG: hypothetical protein WD312_01060 [Candidatus Paceibacterota bacterium]
MSTTVPAVFPKTGVDAIDSLDLDPIKVKLMDSEEGQGWSREKADQMEQAYKAFLYLNLKYPDQPIVPTGEIDAFWHQHILDTRKYAEDCQQVFGHMLHHFPYFGMRGEQDAQNLQNAFEETKHLFEEVFGISLENAVNCSISPGSCDAPQCYPSKNLVCQGGNTLAEARPTLV